MPGSFQTNYVTNISTDCCFPPSKENKEKGKFIDLGCGPGQATKFLNQCGISDIIGTDLSPAMVRLAKSNFPDVHFETADILGLKFPDQHFGAAIAMYAIVHFNYEALKAAFIEIKRVLSPGGEFLFSFHIGDEVVHRDNFLDHPVNVDFYFFEPDKIKKILEEIEFEVIDIMERHPYPDIEYPSKRAYIWAKKSANPFKPSE